jgi:BirA family biotin operon repressor/biotin-[acetyl-CoA-carboxylase] ligase
VNRVIHHIVERLRQEGKYVSGEVLSEELGISRAAVCKHVAGLRDLGYQIDAAPRRGYCLRKPVDKPVDTEVLPLLQTRTFGRVLQYYEKVDSTNRVATELAELNYPEGTVVTSDRQTAGRGRMQREWLSPDRRNLYFSVLLRPPAPVVRIPQLALVVGISIRETVAQIAPLLDVRIKWPNDVYLKRKKLGGVLCEMSAESDCIRHVVVGVGLNVNMRATDFTDGLRKTASSLRIGMGGKKINRADLLAKLLYRMEKDYDTWLHSEDLEPFMAQWAQYSMLEGMKITVEQPGRTLAGTVKGISPTGELLLLLPDESVVEVSSGDAHIKS